MLVPAPTVVTLQFIGGDDLISRGISWFSAGHLSHVDICMPNGKLVGARTQSYKGIPAGVQERPANYFGKAQHIVRFNLPATDTQARIFYDFLGKQIKRPYDYAAIWGFVFGRDWRETDSWICSELAAAALERAKIAPKFYLAANKITPVALALACSVISEPLLVGT